MKNKYVYKMIIEYDGTNYYGWQYQPNLPTIQGEIQQKLSIILNEPKKIQGAGRTDAGVHAIHQVAHFKYEKLLDLKALKKSLNSLLPNDIRIKEIELADAKFNSRFSAKWKEYTYYLYNGEICSPFICRYVWHYPHQLDLEIMKEAAKKFIGIHNFSSFGTGALENENVVRSIDYFEIEKNGETIIFKLRGKSFLRHMVRWIVGIIVEIGEGKKTINELDLLFQEKKYGLIKLKAPACGLFLTYICYE